MTEEDPALEQALRQLRRDYLAAGPARVAELWSALTGVQNGDADALERLRLLAHRLAGSGGGYGFPSISQAGRHADQLSRELLARASPPDPSALTQLTALVQGIADAFAGATAPE